jgi:alpha-beta hydrolase superfamily lysophospholipase
MTTAGDIQTIVSSGRGSRPDARVVFRAWPAADAKAAVILLHGLGGHSDRFQECGRYWASRGISVYAPDIPGFGHTEGPKGHLDSFEPVFDMIEVMVARVMADNSRRPVFIVAESMGAAVAIDWVSRRPALLSGMVLLAPALKDRLNVPLWRKLEALAHVLVRRRKYYDVPFEPDNFTRDAAIKKVLDADPLEVRRVTAQFYFAWLPVTNRALRAAPLLKLPVAVLLPGNDVMIDTEATKAWFTGLPEATRTLIEYPGLLHGLLVEEDRQPVLDDIADWILKQAGC